jgi:NADP-dependent 3-hydroxy acid dehydrogenase YdfG
MSLLENKTAIVTGATSGIGRAIALNLARDGAYVFLTGRVAERLEEAARMIRQEGGLASVEAFDLRESDRLQTFVAVTAKEAGRLDIMVNAAGVDHPGTIADGGHTEWRDMFGSRLGDGQAQGVYSGHQGQSVLLRSAESLAARHQ